MNMNPNTHTPGPWIIDGQRPDLERELCIWAGGLIVAEAIHDQHGNEEANARLIAAAPDLLAALEALATIARTFRNVPAEEQYWGTLDDEVLEKAFAVIIKAKGQQS